MKRIALLTVLLLVVGLSLGFAQEVKPAVSWATVGSATLTWGINLDTMETGFTNAGAATLSLTLVPETSLTKGAEAPVYGWISLATFKWVDGAWTQPTVTAKIMAAPIEIGINTAPTLAIGKAGVVEGTADSVLEAETALTGTAFAGNGTYVGYVSTPISIYAKIVSVGDWTRSKDAIMNYAAGLDGSLAFAPVAIGFGVYDGLWTGAVPIGYVTAGLTVAPIAVSIAADFSLATTVAFDLSAALSFTLVPNTTLALNVSYGNNFNGIDAKIVFAEAGGLVKGLTETLTVYVLDIAAPDARAMEYEVINALSYAIALSDTTSVTPTVTVTYGVNTETTNTILKLVAGVAMALIPNTTITLTYTSDDFIVVAPAVMKLGNVTCAVAVAY